MVDGDQKIPEYELSSGFAEFFHEHGGIGSFYGYGRNHKACQVLAVHQEKVEGEDHEGEGHGKAGGVFYQGARKADQLARAGHEGGFEFMHYVQTAEVDSSFGESIYKPPHWTVRAEGKQLGVFIDEVQEIPGEADHLFHQLEG